MLPEEVFLKKKGRVFGSIVVDFVFRRGIRANVNDMFADNAAAQSTIQFMFSMQQIIAIKGTF